MSKKLFWSLFSGAFLLVILIGGVSSVFAVQNKAISLEEQIKESESSINIQEKRRSDLIINLADTVKAFSKHEKETFVELAKARTTDNGGQVNNATLAIKSVAEAYPELKSDTDYTQLMTELSATENLISQHRDNYNIQVKSYNKHIRKFPNSIILTMLGYDKINSDYLKYEAPSDAPTGLFDEDK